MIHPNKRDIINDRCPSDPPTSHYEHRAASNSRGARYKSYDKNEGGDDRGKSPGLQGTPGYSIFFSDSVDEGRTLLSSFRVDEEGLPLVLQASLQVDEEGLPLLICGLHFESTRRVHPSSSLGFILMRRVRPTSSVGFISSRQGGSAPPRLLGFISSRRGGSTPPRLVGFISSRRGGSTPPRLWASFRVDEEGPPLLVLWASFRVDEEVRPSSSVGFISSR